MPVTPWRMEDGDYEWSCFAAQQAAEKALKAVVQRLGGEPRGHSVTVLLGNLSERLDVDAEPSPARSIDRRVGSVVRIVASRVAYYARGSWLREAEK